MALQLKINVDATGLVAHILEMSTNGPELVGDANTWPPYNEYSASEMNDYVFSLPEVEVGRHQFFVDKDHLTLFGYDNDYRFNTEQDMESFLATYVRAYRSQFTKPDWPELADLDPRAFDNYVYDLRVVYVDQHAYGIDQERRFLLPLRAGPEPYRFGSNAEMMDFVRAHNEPGVDPFSHAAAYRDTTVASIPMADKEAHVVYRSGDYAFLKMPEDPDWIQKEGRDLQQCLSVAHHDYCKRMVAGEIDLYSMTDIKTGIPVVDIEVAKTRSSYGGPVTRPTVTQLRGIRNECPPRDKYLEPLADFFKNYGKDWELKGIRSFDGRSDGEEFLKRLNELRSAQA